MKTSQHRPLFSFTAALLPRRLFASRSAALLILLVLVSAWLGQDASAATYVWTNSPNTSSTSATNTNSYVTNGGSAFATNNFLGGGNFLIYTNNYSQSSAQTFNFNGVNVTNGGLTVTNYTNNVIFTNVGAWRFTTNGITANNSSGLGTLYIYNTNQGQLLGSIGIQGNMSVYLNNFANHSTTGRTVTNNSGSLAINNFLVNAASQTTIGGANGVSFTWEGTGTTTILGTIMVVAQTNTTGTTNNNGALIVKSGTINIATTNGANASTTATNVDNSSVYGWNSGLVITNSGSVYVLAQNSLGMQAFNIKMGTTNGGTTTFGLFDSNSWATNTNSSTLTNNFDIANSGTTATNVFKSVTNKALTLSGVISSANTNGTIVFQGTGGTNVLVGANTFSNAVVVSNTTLMLSNASALGATNAGTTVAGTSGRLDLNGQTITAEALTLSNSSAPSLLNSSATAASWSGGVTLAAATAISNNTAVGAGLAGDITLSGSISGSSSLTKSGVATLILSGSNSYTGATTISDGWLVLDHTNALSGSTLSYSNAGTVSFGSLTGANLGGLQGSTNLALTNASGTALALSVGGNNSNTTYSGILSGDGSLAKAGTGTLILTGLNTYGGTTTVGRGTLQVTNLANAGTSSAIGTNGTIILTNGGVLSYAGTTNTSMDRGINLAVGNGGLGVSNSAAALTVSAEITNTGNLVKSGAGTLILSASNSFTGTTTVSAGALVLGNTNALSGSTLAGVAYFGSLTGANIGGLQGSTNMGLTNASGAAVTLRVGGNNSNTTYSGILSGVGSLTKVGSGTLTLSGANSLQGTTTISDGALVLGHTNALYYSVLDYSSAGTVSFGVTAANIYALQGSNNLALTNGSGAAVALQLGSSNTTTNTTYSGILSGTGSLIKSGTRTLTLGAANTYEGGTTINAGAINISNGSSFGSGTVTFASNSTTVSALASMEVTNNYVLTGNGTMNMGANIMMTNSGVISGAGSLTKAGAGTLLLSRSSNSYGGVTTISGGALQVTDLADEGIVSPIGTNGTIMLTNGGNFDYVGTSSGASMNRALNLAGGNGGIGVSDSSVAVTFSGVISNTGNLVKSGAGTLILSASNSYTGSTTVSAGTLELASLTGSAAGSASSVTVTNGATLLVSQSDQVNNSATVTLSGGTIARGSGVSEVFGDLNLTVASFLDFGTGATGNMTFGTYTPGSLLTINNFTQVNMLVFGSDLTSSINDTSLFTFTNGAIGSSSWNGSTFTITAIPETSTYLAALGLLCLGALPLVRRKRAKIS